MNALSIWLFTRFNAILNLQGLENFGSMAAASQMLKTQ
jgi:hypothetical protein